MTWFSKADRLTDDQDEKAAIEQEAAIEDAESKYIDTRRAELGALGIGNSSPHRVGLALSGGGIRSATFSLGVLKSLSHHRLIHRLDYLSTVSGGSYAGAFYASLFTPPECRGATGEGWTSPLDDPDPLGKDAGEKAIRHLRESGRYLLPDGAGDALRLSLMAIRGWLAVQIVIGVSLLAIFSFGKALQATLVRTEWVKAIELCLAEKDWSPWLWPVQWLKGYPLGPTIMLSSLWPVAILCLAVCVAFGWAFWLTRVEHLQQWRLWRTLLNPGLWGSLAVALICLGPKHAPPTLESILTVFGVLVLGGSVAYVVAQGRGFLFRGVAEWNDANAKPREQEDRVRSHLTAWATKALFWAVAVGVLALVDTIGQTAYTQLLQENTSAVTTPLTIGAIIAAATPFLQRILGWVQGLGKMRDGWRRFGRIVAIVVALLLALAIMSLWATAADYLAWRGAPIGAFDVIGARFAWTELHSPWSELNSLWRDLNWLWCGWNSLPTEGRALRSLWLTAAIFIALAVVIGLSFGFLNLSSFSGFYAGRLRRAYLGASNSGRVSKRRTSDFDDAGDDIALADYYAPKSGAPLHLINVTINETRGKGSSLVQRDRKGRPMTVSSAGYLVPTGVEKRSRILFADDAEAQGKIRATADLPLSTWVAISGAAFSTALGHYTSLGFSLLAGLANLRLGYWWTPLSRALGISPFQWTQAYLMVEFFARFGGIFSHRWYLTDGGHFENTGIYELVRRRVPLIVACDNGADPDYNFADIVNLTRKLRIDFDADLDFLPKRELDSLLDEKSPTRAIFGELSELVRLSKEQRSRGPYAAIARIRAPERKDSEGNVVKREYLGTLILLKPRLSGLEMADLLDYHRLNEQFPQQTTGDQFFDEAQWESYYRLGITIADLVFGDSKSGASWSPRSLTPIDPEKVSWFADEWAPASRKTEPDEAARQRARLARARRIARRSTVSWFRFVLFGKP